METSPGRRHRPARDATPPPPDQPAAPPDQPAAPTAARRNRSAGHRPAGLLRRLPDRAAGLLRRLPDRLAGLLRRLPDRPAGPLRRTAGLLRRLPDRAAGGRRAGPGRRAAGAAPGPDPDVTAEIVPRELGRGHRRARPATGTRLPADPPRRRPAGTMTGDAADAAATDPETPGLDGSGDPPERATRRRAVLVALGVTAAASAAALVAGLPRWSPEPADPARRLTRGEIERLSAMRVTNQRDVRAGVHVSIGAGDARSELVGWVDWARPLVYLDIGGPGAGAERGLVQATASTVLVRPALAATPGPTPPPLVPPADRWRLREPLPTDGVAAVRDLLLGLRADRTDLVPVAARWQGRDTTDGTPVDILETPFPADPAPAAGPVRLWLDGDARLHRLEGRLPDGRPVTVQLARSDRPTLHPVAALGGRPGLPRTLTDGEAGRLARLPVRLRALRGATVTLTAPLHPTANLRAAGWLSWTDSAAYLAVDDADTPGRRTLLRCRAGRVARASAPAGPMTEPPGAPPLPPPAGLAWSAARPPGDDLERLLAAALRAGATPAPARSAVRLREDRTADRTVDVIEVRTGGTALRYWVDRGGLLRRLELRTGRGVWAQLDLTPGRVPALPGAGGRAAAKPGRR